jgi:hypothetical protein
MARLLPKDMQRYTRSGERDGGSVAVVVYRVFMKPDEAGHIFTASGAGRDAPARPVRLTASLRAA